MHTHTHTHTYHDRKHYTDLLNYFKDTQQKKEADLIESVGMYSNIWYTTKVMIVWFVLVWN